MKNKNSIIALSIGLLSGGLAFALLFQRASELENKTTPVEVLVATRYIPSGNFLNKEMVETKSIPEAFVSPSSIHDLHEVDGLMNLVPISTGEQILSNKFVPAEDSLALSLAPGMRAYTIEVNETTGVGNLIRPGNHVDLLTKTEAGHKEITAFVFQNLQVLAVGQKMNWRKPSDSSAQTSPSDESAAGTGYNTVTLAVTPEQAEILMYLDSQSLRLVLRAPHDEDVVLIPPKSEEEVLSRLGRFVPPKAGKSIEIIHGNSGQGE